ncbi:Acetyltransferase (isoleucine patch superfamily) [Levilactobacillus zymae]|uniref:Acetyltransferase (Isoleucine patch superfamily) n=2 Tax=Levilactobacillus zymae TaxID=267363 RepID=A0A1Y6JT33_9LACO|nr:Acetyltransferase (isoleucine patch superfamily) [Levilactobacillus zymae]
MPARNMSVAEIAAQQATIDRNQLLVQKLNTGQHQPAEIRAVVGELTGRPLDPSVEIRLPFYTDYGRNLTIGKRVMINDQVQFTDLGGITLADDVLIGPGAALITVNHQLNPAHRRALTVAPITIEQNAWIGAKAIILPGVTVGQDAVVAAGAVVTKDVPANAVVAGVPAKVIKII